MTNDKPHGDVPEETWQRALNGEAGGKASNNPDVGYGRPPKHTRFKKGHSGNPKGRPKRARNVNSIIKDVVFQTVEVTLDGKKRKITLLEATLRRLANQAISKNDRKAAEQLVNFAFRAGASEIAPAETTATPAQDQAIIQTALERLIAEREAGEAGDDPATPDEEEA